MVTIDELREYRNAEPFRPFYVILSDGRKLLVRQAENIGYSPSGRRVGIADHPDAIDSVDASAIVKLQLARRTAKRNGR